MEQDRSRHAVCRLNTALHLLAGKNVYVPARAFRAFNPSRAARALQMANSSLNLTYSIPPGHTIVSGPSFAYLTGEVDYSDEHVTSRGLRFLASKQPFFVISGDTAASLQHEIGCDSVPKPRLRFCSQCVAIVLANYHGTPAVFRVGGCDEARAEVRRQIAGIKLATSIRSLHDLVPQPLGQFSTPSGFEVSVESALSGCNAPFSRKRIDAIWELWMAARSFTSEIARPCLSQELQQVCEALPEHQEALSGVSDSLLEWHSASRVPGGFAHGDLWLGNVLFFDDCPSGIVDWEWAHKDGLHVVDALSLLLMSYSVFHKLSIAKTLRDFWADTIEDHELRSSLTRLCHCFGFDTTDLKFAAAILWFDYFRERVIRGRMPNAAWTTDMLPRTIPVVQAWLKTCKRATSQATAAPRTNRVGGGLSSKGAFH